MEIDRKEIKEKFGGDYIADGNTFVMGIDRRFTNHFASRFSERRILETCAGAGFTTIALAKIARKVISVEIEPLHLVQAKQNVKTAGISNRVVFVLGNILDPDLLNSLADFDCAFIDPDWAVSGPKHEYRFRNANTRPPADVVLSIILQRTKNVAIVLPPFIDIRELDGLPPHERQSLYLDTRHELYCLYFGDLKTTVGETVFHETNSPSSC